MAKIIGRGSFTTVYTTDDPTRVKVFSTCSCKEAYCDLSQGNPFAPIVFDRGEGRREGEQMYFMPLYAKIKAPKMQLNERSYAIYRHLRSAGLGLNYFEFCSFVQNSNFLSAEEKEHLTDLAGDVGNYIDPYDLRFEISPRNVASNENGDLIMLDCFFCLEKLWSHKA